MIGLGLAATLVLGAVVPLRSERRRLRRLRERFLVELEGLAAHLERRRTLLGVALQDLPDEVPACHGDLEVLGRHQRGAAEALARLWTRPSDRGAAAAFVEAEAGFRACLGELREGVESRVLDRLASVQERITRQRRAVDDAYLHLEDRRLRCLRARASSLLGPGPPGWAPALLGA